jgi:hypothetical protein
VSAASTATNGQTAAPPSHTSLPSAAPVFNFTLATQGSTKPPTPSAKSPHLNFSAADQFTNQSSLPTTQTPSFNLQPPATSSFTTGLAFGPAAKVPGTANQQQSTTSPFSPVRPPAPTKPAVNKSEVIHHAARLALTQPHGLIEEFLEWCLPAVLQRVQRQHEAEVRQKSLGEYTALLQWISLTGVSAAKRGLPLPQIRYYLEDPHLAKQPQQACKQAPTDVLYVTENGSCSEAAAGG